MTKASSIKRPKNVTILGKRIRITYHENNPDAEVVGLFDPGTMCIHILDTDNWESCLLHEIIHAALHISGASTMLETKEEESLVTALEHALFGIYTRAF